MSERQQITYMQTRIARMAHERWGLTLREVAQLFGRWDAFGYIARNFGIFHLEGDDAVLDDVAAYLRTKGVDGLGALA